MKATVRSILVVCMVAVLSVYAQASDSTETDDNQSAARLQQLLGLMTTLQGNFTQSLYDNDGTLLEESQGQFVLKRPGKFYWKTEQPYPQLLISDQQTIWLYDPDLEQVTVRPFSDDLQQTPALLLSEDVNTLRQSFTIRYHQAEAGHEHFTLIPRSAKGLFQQLTLVFVAEQLQEFRLHDNLGQQTLFLLQDAQRNQAVNDSLFDFTPPPGVDVLHE